MRSYSHLSEDERDQIGVLRAAGRSMGASSLPPFSMRAVPIDGAAARRWTVSFRR